MRRLSALLLVAPALAVAQESLFAQSGAVRARDPLLDQADLVGRVCDDLDQDGRCTSADGPIAGAVIVLESGAVSFTNRDGTYRFRNVAPGQALVKIDVDSLPPGSRAVGSARRVIELPRAGLIAQDFPVRLTRDVIRIGRPEKIGYKLFINAAELPVSVVGNVNDLKALANGSQVRLPTTDAELTGMQQGLFIKLGEPQSIQLRVAYPVAAPTSWQLDVYDAARAPIRTFTGQGVPPKAVAWDGADTNKKPVAPGQSFSLRACVLFADGEKACSPYRAFGTVGPRGSRPKVERPDVKPIAEINGQAVPLDPDGSFLRGVAPDDKRVIKLSLGKPDGRTCTATLHVPSLDLTRPTGAVPVEWGKSSPEVAAPAGGNKVVVHIAGTTQADNRLNIGDRAAPVGRDGQFTRDLTVPKGKSRFEITAVSPSGYNSIYEMGFWLSDKDPEGKPIVAVARVPDMEVMLPAEGSSLSLQTYEVRGKTTPSNKVTVNGAEAPVAADGTFKYPVALRAATSIKVEVTDPDGNHGEVSRNLDATTPGLVPVAFADASPGNAFSNLAGRSSNGAVISGGAELALHYQPPNIRARLAVGALPSAPRTLEVPINAGAEMVAGPTVIGLHALGLYFQDFTASNAATRALAQRGYVVAPTAAISFPIGGSARGYGDLGYELNRGEPTDANSLSRDILSERRQYVTAGLGATYPLSRSVELALRGGADHALQAPASANPVIIERIHGYFETALRPPDLAGSAFFLRYTFDSDRHSFDTVPRKDAVQRHVLALATSYDVLTERPGFLRISPALAATFEVENKNAVRLKPQTLPLYYGLVRADLRPWSAVNIGVDYRLQFLPQSGAAREAMVHYLSLDFAYEVTTFARVGVYGGMKQLGGTGPVSPNERQVMARLQVYY